MRDSVISKDSGAETENEVIPLVSGIETPERANYFQPNEGLIVLGCAGLRRELGPDANLKKSRPFFDSPGFYRIRVRVTSTGRELLVSKPSLIKVTNPIGEERELYESLKKTEYLRLIDLGAPRDSGTREKLAKFYELNPNSAYRNAILLALVHSHFIRGSSIEEKSVFGPLEELKRVRDPIYAEIAKVIEKQARDLFD